MQEHFEQFFKGIIDKELVDQLLLQNFDTVDDLAVILEKRDRIRRRILIRIGHCQIPQSLNSNLSLNLQIQKRRITIQLKNECNGI